MKIMMSSVSMISMVAAAMLWTTAGFGEPAVSPQSFCRSNGGTVQETGDPAVHICCYTARQRCLAVDLRSRTSVRVIFPSDVSGAVPEAEIKRSNVVFLRSNDT
jgi:hypothetical protein